MFYTREGLQKLCEDLKVDFGRLTIEENEDYKKTTISGICHEANCENEFSLGFKSFRRGAKCSAHLPGYDIDFLREYCDRYEIKLTEEYKNVNRESVIKGKCINTSCIELFEKKFRVLVEDSGPYCVICTEYFKKEKMKKTNLEKRGVDNPGKDPNVLEKMKKTNLEKRGYVYALQDPKIQEKSKQTNLKKRGVDNPGKDPNVREKMKKTNLERYGVENPNQNSEIRDKIKNTNLERYGVENPSQNSEIKEKRRKTNLKIRKVEYFLQDPKIKEKIKLTNLERYGVENPNQNSEIRDKIKNTNLERYGVVYPLQNLNIQEKMRQTNLERYGVFHPMQVPEIQEKCMKNSFQYKTYILPSGNEIFLQGYESFVLDVLLQKYKENDIVTGTGNMPMIWWTDSEEKKHRYYVDIYIPKTNTMIEVKSDYTFSREAEISLRKQDAALKENYNHEIWVFNGKKQLMAIIQQTTTCVKVKWLIKNDKLKEVIYRGAALLDSPEVEN